MLTTYIQAAMRRAVYEMLPDDEGFYGEIPGLQGVWANAPTLEACRQELQGALETWIVVGLRHNHTFPTLDGEDLSLRREIVAGLDDVAVF
ncbi:MAG: type II toxin-antitoxin system HicB family antitoxin [Chloroflexi bacterium]|nr:type II toxin-antitoxin system HicB family antitoxin [Chloroflexota bacterium]